MPARPLKRPASAMELQRRPIQGSPSDVSYGPAIDPLEEEAARQQQARQAASAGSVPSGAASSSGISWVDTLAAAALATGPGPSGPSSGPSGPSAAGPSSGPQSTRVIQPIPAPFVPAPGPAPFTPDTTLRPVHLQETRPGAPPSRPLRGPADIVAPAWRTPQQGEVEFLVRQLIAGQGEVTWLCRAVRADWTYRPPASQ